MKPGVSITMPVLNGSRYIDRSLESIMAQTYQNFELIVVDDGSTDDTRQHIDRFASRADLRCIRHSRPAGITRSVNDGLRHSTRKYIAFLDHDDTWLPHFLETQVAYLDTHPDVGMVHADFQTIDADGNILEDSVARCRQRTRPSGHVFPQLFMDSFVVGNSVLIRKEVFDRLGGFDESLRWGDYHMWLRIARNYRIDYVPEVLTQYRQHATQSTRTVASTHPVEDSVAIKSIHMILELYPEARVELGEQRVRRRLASLYFDMAYGSFQGEAMANARQHLRKAIGLWPTNRRYLMLYAATLVPARARAAARRARGQMTPSRASRATDADAHPVRGPV
jgi:glycosyltransferase involved in cell wall biosynthesis